MGCPMKRVVATSHACDHGVGVVAGGCGPARSDAPSSVGTGFGPLLPSQGPLQGAGAPPGEAPAAWQPGD